MTLGASWETTPQGGLRVPARISRTGVLRYPWGKEFRPEDAQFSPESLRTLHSAPVVVTHGTGNVSTSDYQKRTVGVVDAGSVSREDVDGRSYARATLTINDGPTVEAIRAGKLRELSAGYRCRIVPTRGEHDGERFDATQLDVVYNHVALLGPGEGRAGEDVSIRYDSTYGEKSMPFPASDEDKKKLDEKRELTEADGAPPEAKQEAGAAAPNNPDPAPPAADAAHAPAPAAAPDATPNAGNTETAVIMVGSDSYTVPVKLAMAIQALQAELSSGVEDPPEEGEDPPEEPAATRADANDRFDAAVNERVELLFSAKRFGVEVAREDSNIDIMKKCVLKRNPAISKRFDSNDSLIEGAYVALCDLQNDANASRAALVEAVHSRSDSAEVKVTDPTGDHARRMRGEGAKK